MKLFSRKFLALFLILGFAFNAKATNDTLTIGQAFNLQVGDTLIYSGYENSDAFLNTINQGRKGFTVLNKQTAPDTIDYTCQLLGLDTSIKHLIITHLDAIPDVSMPSHFYGLAAFPFIGNCALNPTYNIVCDSGVYGCISYPPFKDSLFYNRVELLSRTNYFEGGGSARFLEKVGIYNSNWGSMGYITSGFANCDIWGCTGSCNIQLVYYHSGSTIWMDTANYLLSGILEPSSSSPSFHLSPNPASDEITISTEAQNGTALDAYIYDITGNCVATHKNISAHLQNIKVFSLPPGYYFVKVTDEHANSAVKSFIVAR